MLEVGELTRTEVISLKASLSAAPVGDSPHLLDTTMLFGPRSGGVKRYLLAKHNWLARERPHLRHSLVVPGRVTRASADGMVSIAAPPIPFGDGYRCPTSLRKWTRILAHLRPNLIEVGDTYVPGHAALDAAEALGAPTVAFCHSDPAALAALHFGEWAAAPAQKRVAKFYSRCDLVVAPSRYIAGRLAEAGVSQVTVQPLGVDLGLFHPSRADRDTVRSDLGLDSKTRLLVFAGRPAREKNLETLLDMLDLLGEDYRLMMIAAGAYWANQAWGSYWSWDPKETWAAITWLVYAGYLHMRITRGWKGRRAAWFAILGFAVVIFTFFGVTYLLPGLHAYAAG